MDHSLFPGALPKSRVKSFCLHRLLCMFSLFMYCLSKVFSGLIEKGLVDRTCPRFLCYTNVGRVCSLLVVPVCVCVLCWGVRSV